MIFLALLSAQGIFEEQKFSLDISIEQETIIALHILSIGHDNSFIEHKNAVLHFCS